ncbi:hypothetical protein ACI2IX_19930 [Leifsonia aquatica]|uniref:hypothetical protein n=1 Tax=Leifsonia aquatica TaxID=144185 RepID=UPI003851221C
MNLVRARDSTLIHAPGCHVSGEREIWLWAQGLTADEILATPGIDIQVCTQCSPFGKQPQAAAPSANWHRRTRNHPQDIVVHRDGTITTRRGALLLGHWSQTSLGAWDGSCVCGESMPVQRTRGDLLDELVAHHNGQRY